MIDQSFLERIGVFQDEDGAYFRKRPRTRNLQFADAPDAQKKGLLVAYDIEDVPFPVVLPLATDPDSILEAQAKAKARGADFYHPKWGWLRWGVKREVDHDENLGAGAISYPTRRVVVAPPAEGAQGSVRPSATATAPKGGK